MVDISSVVDATLALIGVMAVLGMGLATISLQSAQPMSTTTPKHRSTCDELRRAA
jgi:hypothetical protein